MELKIFVDVRYPIEISNPLRENIFRVAFVPRGCAGVDGNRSDVYSEKFTATHRRALPVFLVPDPPWIEVPDLLLFCVLLLHQDYS